MMTSTQRQSRRIFLTKSNFLKACECPRKLLYALSPDFDENEASDFRRHLAETGQKIGAYSRLLFPDGIEIGPSSGGRVGDKEHLEELLEQTKELLLHSSNNKPVTLFEAAIRSGPLLVRADILHKDETNQQLKLLEVKAKAWDSRQGIDKLMLTNKGAIRAEYRPYLRDLAFQKVVVQQAFPDLNVSASLVLPDKAVINTQIPNLNSMFQVISSTLSDDEYGQQRAATEIRLEEEDRHKILLANEMLVTEVDVDPLVDQILDDKLEYPGCGENSNFREVVAEWGEIVQQQEKWEEAFAAPPPIGAHCRDCEYRPLGFQQCWQQATGLAPIEQRSGLITELYHGGKTADKLIAARKFRMADVQPEDLGLDQDGQDVKKKSPGFSRKEKQWHQVSDHQVPVLDRDFLLNEMSTWEYPYHFVDFETTSPALPYTTGKGPFTTLAFQFSHHTMNQDGTVEHASEFLFACPGECPNLPFLETLQNHLASRLASEGGTVFRWGAHENTVLSALLRSTSTGTEENFFLALESLLVGGDRAMIDLMQVLAKGYYAPGSGASLSIKKLLVPTLRASDRLQKLYGQPTYSSKNFTNMQWWVESSPSESASMGAVPRDPYSLLAEFDNETGSTSVARGGDAIAAYETLQQEDLDPDRRCTIEASLRRYCELDTLAMAMMIQGIQDLLDHSRQ